MGALSITGWLLVGLLVVAVVLVVLALVAESEPRPPRPVRVRRHSLDDAQQSTTRLRPAPPPELKYGGVVGRPRAMFLDDEEWIERPRK